MSIRHIQTRVRLRQAHQADAQWHAFLCVMFPTRSGQWAVRIQKHIPTEPGPAMPVPDWVTRQQRCAIRKAARDTYRERIKAKAADLAHILKQPRKAKS